MAKPTYVEAVDWIAQNDAPGDELPVDELALTISVMLVADLFSKSPKTVARDVLGRRGVPGYNRVELRRSWVAYDRRRRAAGAE